MKKLGYNLPTKFSSTELFPALCPPTTAICGRSRLHVWPMELKASWSLLMRGMRSSIPRFPMMAARLAPGGLCPALLPVGSRRQTAALLFQRRHKEKKKEKRKKFPGGAALSAKVKFKPPPKKRDSLRSEESRLKSKHRRGGYVEARMI